KQSEFRKGDVGAHLKLPSVTSGASVNKYTASTITAVTPKLNQSVRPKKRTLGKLPGTGSEDLWNASCGVGLGSGMSFIETRLPTYKHHGRKNLYGSIAAIVRRRSFNRAGLLLATVQQHHGEKPGIKCPKRITR